jgi:hypothetical protein
MDQAEIRLIRQIFIKGSVAEVFFPLLITLLASQQLIENLLDLWTSVLPINISHPSSGIPASD